MANIKSQIKRVKTNEKRRQRNKSVRSSVRTAVRRFREAVEAGDTEKATELQRAAAKALDKAASKGVIHKNQAANRKSAMAKRVTTLPPDAPPSRRRRSLRAAPFRRVRASAFSGGRPAPRTCAAPPARARSRRPAPRP